MLLRERPPRNQSWEMQNLQALKKIADEAPSGPMSDFVNDMKKLFGEEFALEPRKGLMQLHTKAIDRCLSDRKPANTSDPITGILSMMTPKIPGSLPCVDYTEQLPPRLRKNLTPFAAESSRNIS